MIGTRGHRDREAPGPPPRMASTHPGRGVTYKARGKVKAELSALR